MPQKKAVADGCRNGESELDISIDFIRRIARAAAAETLPRFRSQGAVANKQAESFDPVTEADREAERAIRALIAAEYPDHGILGEEHGSENMSSRHVWVIDPIVDGIGNFGVGLARFSAEFDRLVVDGLVNVVGWLSNNVGGILRNTQDGNVQVYLLLVAVSMTVWLLLKALPIFLKLV